MLNPKECAVLGAISEGSIHGYELMQTLRERGYEEWTEISLPSVYRIIRDLERKGYLQGKLEEGTRGAPRKRFSLVPKGRDALVQSLIEHLENPVRARSSFDLGIAHVDLLDRGRVREAVRVRVQSLEQSHATMQRRWKEQQPMPWNVEALFVHGEQRYLAEVHYLNYLLRRLEQE